MVMRIMSCRLDVKDVVRKTIGNLESLVSCKVILSLANPDMSYPSFSFPFRLSSLPGNQYNVVRRRTAERIYYQIRRRSQLVRFEC